MCPGQVSCKKVRIAKKVAQLELWQRDCKLSGLKEFDYSRQRKTFDSIAGLSWVHSACYKSLQDIWQSVFIRLLGSLHQANKGRLMTSSKKIGMSRRKQRIHKIKWRTKGERNSNKGDTNWYSKYSEGWELDEGNNTQWNLTPSSWVSVSAPAAPWLLLSATNSCSKKASRLRVHPARHHDGVVGHLQGEHAKALASAGQHGLFEVGELAAPPGALGLQLLALAEQLRFSTLHLREVGHQVAFTELLTKR